MANGNGEVGGVMEVTTRSRGRTPGDELSMAGGEEPISSVDIDGALETVSAPRQTEPPEILPNFEIPHDDALEKETVRAEMEEAASPPLMLGIRNAGASEAATAAKREAMKMIYPEIVVPRIHYLTNLGGLQYRPRPNNLIEYSQKVGVFIAQLEISTLDQILSKEMNVVFLQQLLDDILEIPADEVVGSNGETSVTSSTRSGDLVLEALAAAPSCYRRADAALLYQFADAIW